MKKRLILTVLFFLVTLIIFQQVIAVDIVKVDYANPENTRIIGIDPQNPPSSPEELANDAATYLKGKWTTILQNNKFTGPIIRALNPLFKFFVGYEFTVSLIFFIALILSFVLWEFCFRGINVFYKDSFMSLILSFLVVIISNSAGFTRQVVPKIYDLINIIWWKQVIFFVVMLIILSIIEYGYQENKKRSREAALENLAETEKNLKESSTDLKGVVKGMEDIKEGYDKSS